MCEESGAAGAGEAGRDGLPMIDDGLLKVFISDEVRFSDGAVGDMTSRTPPPDVVSGLSAVVFRQNDQPFG